MVSFGHAAYFGLGAIRAALLFKNAGWSMGASLLAAPFVAAIGGAIFGWFSVRLSGVYLAMLTLAFCFARIGGRWASNGILADRRLKRTGRNLARCRFRQT